MTPSTYSCGGFGSNSRGYSARNATVGSTRAARHAGKALAPKAMRMRKIAVGGSPNVTRAGMAIFPAPVRMEYP
jgi:hypothetical protein